MTFKLEYRECNRKHNILKLTCILIQNLDREIFLCHPPYVFVCRTVNFKAALAAHTHTHTHKIIIHQIETLACGSLGCTTFTSLSNRTEALCHLHSTPPVMHPAPQRPRHPAGGSLNRWRHAEQLTCDSGVGARRCLRRESRRGSRTQLTDRHTPPLIRFAGQIPAPPLHVCARPLCISKGRSAFLNKSPLRKS